MNLVLGVSVLSRCESIPGGVQGRQEGKETRLEPLPDRAGLPGIGSYLAKPSSTQLIQIENEPVALIGLPIPRESLQLRAIAAI